MTLEKDFHSEIDSQTEIVFYVLNCFEKEFKYVSRWIDYKIDFSSVYNENAQFMSDITAKCDEILTENLSKYLPIQKLPEWIKKLDWREPAGELLDSLMAEIDCCEKPDVDKIKKELQKIYLQYGNDAYKFSDSQLKELIDAAYILTDRKHNQRLSEMDSRLEAFKITIKLIDTSSYSNIFRQSFINIMSIFDAYVFDFLKVYFKKHPNKIETFFQHKQSDKVKIDIDYFLQFDNIENLRNDIVERQLSGKYLSEIIRKLYRFNKNLFQNIEFTSLMEIIERRNIHLHNRGIVDAKYLSEFNIYGLTSGAFAVIDKKYLFENAFTILSNFTSNLNKHLS